MQKVFITALDDKHPGPTSSKMKNTKSAGLAAFGLISRFNVRRKKKIAAKLDHISLYWNHAFDFFRLISLAARRPTTFTTDYPYPLVPHLPFQRRILLGDSRFEIQPRQKKNSDSSYEVDSINKLDIIPKIEEPTVETSEVGGRDPEEDEEESLPEIGSRASSSRRGRGDDSKTMFRVLFTTSFNTDMASFEKIQGRYRIAVARTAGCDLSIVRILNIRESTWNFGTQHSIQVETEVVAYGRRAATLIAQRLNLLDFATVLQEQVGPQRVRIGPC